MKNVTSKSILIGNGININFGGKAYTNNYIIKRILFNVRASRYDPLFNGEISEMKLQVFLSDWLHGQMLFLTENMTL